MSLPIDMVFRNAITTGSNLTSAASPNVLDYSSNQYAKICW